MTDLQPATIDQVRSQLSAAQAELARLRGEAEAAADKLRIAPSAEHQAERNRTRDAAELADYATALLRKQMVALEEEQRQAEQAARIEQLHAARGGDNEVIRTNWDRFVTAIHTASDAQGEMGAARRRSRGRMQEARALGEDPGGYLLAAPRLPAALRKEIEELVRNGDKF